MRDGVHVTSVDRDPRGRLDGTGALSLQADLTAGERVLQDAFVDRRIDAVFMLVGSGSVPRSLENPRGDLAANAGSALAGLELLRDRADPPLVIHMSSAAVYGHGRTMPMNEDHPLEPVSPYGISKLAAEMYVRFYHGTYGIPAISLRPFSIYGPGQRKLVIYDLLRRLRHGEKPLLVKGDPIVTRDFVYVGDVARAAVRLARTAPAHGEAYNLCSGRATSLSELVETLIDVAGDDGTPPEFTGVQRTGDPVRWEGDSTRAALLGALCDTPLRKGLQHTARWCAAYE